MKVLLNDGLENEGIELFEKASIKTDMQRRDEKKLIRDIPEYDALIVRSKTKVTENIIRAGSQGRLKTIGRAGVGFDNIDVDAAIKHRVLVQNAPHGVTNATAEHSLTLITALSRNLLQAHMSLIDGIWRKKEFQGVELSHKILGIIGCGRIGQRLSELVRGYDMIVIGYDTDLDRVIERFPDSRIEYKPKEEVLRLADFISIHTGGREAVIGEKELSLMKPSSYLVNASRGSNVDEEALYKALKENKIEGAGLDVHVNEPKTEGERFESRFRELSNVVLSSHLGASTQEGQVETALEIARAIISYLAKGDYVNAVNIRKKEDRLPVYPLFISHQDILGVFARISKVLADSGINIKEIRSNPYQKGNEASTVYILYEEPTQATVDKLRGIENVVSVKV